jgi:hypothetical protein
MDLNPATTLILGIALPFITQLVRLHLLKWEGAAATWLAFFIAALATGIAYFVTDTTPTWQEAFGQLGAIFTLKTLVYRSLGDMLKPKA